MISAFGVEHTISKNWKKMAPKLGPVNAIARKGDDMDTRLRVNYSQWRHKSGWLSREVNPRKFDAMDADNAKYGLKEPHPRVVETRKKGMKMAQEKARTHKEGARAMVDGISARNRRNRGPLP